MKTLVLVLFALFLLSGCGPVLFKVGSVIEVTAGHIITMPAKKKIVEEITEKPSKSVDN